MHLREHNLSLNQGFKAKSGFSTVPDHAKLGAAGSVATQIESEVKRVMRRRGKSKGLIVADTDDLWRADKAHWDRTGEAIRNASSIAGRVTDAHQWQHGEAIVKAFDTVDKLKYLEACHAPHGQSGQDDDLFFRGYPYDKTLIRDFDEERPTLNLDQQGTFTLRKALALRIRRPVATRKDPLEWVQRTQDNVLFITGDVEDGDGWEDRRFDMQWSYDNVVQWVMRRMLKKQGFSQWKSFELNPGMWKESEQSLKASLHFYMRRWMAYWFKSVQTYQTKVLKVMGESGMGLDDVPQYGFMFVNEQECRHDKDTRANTFRWDNELGTFPGPKEVEPWSHGDEKDEGEHPLQSRLRQRFPQVDALNLEEFEEVSAATLFGFIKSIAQRDVVGVEKILKAGNEIGVERAV